MTVLVNPSKIFNDFDDILNCSFPFHTTAIVNLKPNQQFSKTMKKNKLYSWKHTCNPVTTSFIFSVDKSRKDSIKSPSMKPSHGSTLRSVEKLRQKLCSILPTAFITRASRV